MLSFKSKSHQKPSISIIYINSQKHVKYLPRKFIKFQHITQKNIFHPKKRTSHQLPLPASLQTNSHYPTFFPMKNFSLKSSRLTLLKCIHTHKNVATTRNTRDERQEKKEKKTNHLSMMGKNKKGGVRFATKEHTEKKNHAKLLPFFLLTHSLTCSSYRTLFFTT